jgi:hypothetical protein
MMRVLAFELRRAIANRSFVVALLAGCAIVCHHVVFDMIPNASLYLDSYYSMRQAKGEYPLSLYNMWMGGQLGILQNTLYFFILPLLAALPYAASLHSDRAGGYELNVLSRCRRSHYQAAKMLAVFVSGGLAVTLPLMLDFYATSLFFPPLIPEPTSGTFFMYSYSMGAGLFYSSPLAFVALHMLLVFVGSGQVALLALPASRLAASRFIVMLAPFIACVFADFVLTSLGGTLYQYSPLSYLRPDHPGLQALPIIAVTAGMALLSIAIHAWGVRHDEAL